MSRPGGAYFFRHTGTADVTSLAPSMTCTYLTWLARAIIATLVLAALWLAQATEHRQEQRPLALRTGHALQAAAAAASDNTLAPE